MDKRVTTKSFDSGLQSIRFEIQMQRHPAFKSDLLELRNFQISMSIQLISDEKKDIFLIKNIFK